MFLRPLFIILAGAGIVLFQPSLAISEDISVEATVDTKTVTLGSSLRLTVTVNGADNAPAVQLPKVDGLDIRYLGPSTRISLINGKMSRSIGLMFSVIPLRTGQFEIPAVTIPLSGKDYTTETIVFNVVDRGQAVSSSGQDDSGNIAALQDKIFIVLTAPQKEIYLNEPIPVSIKLFISDIAVKNVQFPVLRNDGFNAETFVEPDRSQQVLGGVPYQVLEFKTMIYPTQVGELTLGPAKLGANIMIQSPRRRSFPGDLGNFFDDDVFDEFLGRYETKTIMLESADIGIKVLPLPQEGRPADFSGGIGKYNFAISVSPTDVKVGDPVTVRMRVAGDGNLKSVELPVFKDSDDFKTYDPKIVEQNGEKTLEQVVIPKSEQVKELPAVSFSYFDTAEKKYFTIQKGPFPMTVSPLAKGEEAKVVGTSEQTSTVILDQTEELGKDIHFIKEDIGQRYIAIYNTGWFWNALVLGFIVWLGAFIHFLFRQRLSMDRRLARRLQAPRQAKKGLAAAAVYLAKNDARNFYDNLFRTLNEYFGNKFHLPQNSVTVDAIAKSMKAPGGQTMEDLKNIFAECDMVRFASAQMTPENMKTAYQRCQEIIDFFERNYK